MNRERHAAGTPGSRWLAIRGPCVRVHSCSYPVRRPPQDGGIVGQGDPYAKAVRALKNVEAALHELGARMQDVVRPRMYVVNVDQWEQVGRAHDELFKDVRPATSMVEVSRLGFRPNTARSIE